MRAWRAAGWIFSLAGWLLILAVVFAGVFEHLGALLGWEPMVRLGVYLDDHRSRIAGAIGGGLVLIGWVARRVGRPTNADGSGSQRLSLRRDRFGLVLIGLALLSFGYAGYQAAHGEGGILDSWPPDFYDYEVWGPPGGPWRGRYVAEDGVSVLEVDDDGQVRHSWELVPGRAGVTTGRAQPRRFSAVIDIVDLKVNDQPLGRDSRRAILPRRDAILVIGGKRGVVVNVFPRSTGDNSREK